MSCLYLCASDAVIVFHFSGESSVLITDGIEGLVRDASLKDLQVEDTHQRIAAADAMVEERQRLAPDLTLNPQGHFAQLHGKRVFIDAIDAVGDHVADGFPHLFGRRFVFPGTGTSQFFAQPSRSGQQKVAGPTGRIEDANGKDGVLTK